MTSLHVDLQCVDIIPRTLLASLSRLCALVQNTEGEDNWPNLQRFMNQSMKAGGIKTWKEFTIGVQQLIRLLFNNNFINPIELLLRIMNFFPHSDARNICKLIKHAVTLTLSRPAKIKLNRKTKCRLSFSRGYHNQ